MQTNWKDLLLLGDKKHGNKYLNRLSRGGLIVPSPALADFSCNGFAVLDYVDAIIQRYSRVSVREAGQYVISKNCPNVYMREHIEWGTKFATQIIVNIFYNNKQKLTAVSVRKEAVKTFKKRQREK